MTNPKHPAPWKWNDWSREYCTPRLMQLADGKGTAVLQIHLDDHSLVPDAAASTLIAAAPEMAALLRKHEWTLGLDGDVPAYCCPECGERKPKIGVGVHGPGCAWAAILARIDGAKEET